MRFVISIGPRTIVHVDSVSTRRLWHWEVLGGFCKYGRLVGYKGAETVDSNWTGRTCWTYPNPKWNFLQEAPPLLLAGSGVDVADALLCDVLSLSKARAVSAWGRWHMNSYHVYFSSSLQLADSKSHFAMGALCKDPLTTKACFSHLWRRVCICKFKNSCNCRMVLDDTNLSIKLCLFVTGSQILGWFFPFIELDLLESGVSGRTQTVQQHLGLIIRFSYVHRMCVKWKPFQIVALKAHILRQRTNKSYACFDLALHSIRKCNWHWMIVWKFEPLYLGMIWIEGPDSSSWYTTVPLSRQQPWNSRQLVQLII